MSSPFFQPHCWVMLLQPPPLLQVEGARVVVATVGATVRGESGEDEVSIGRQFKTPLM